MRAGPCVPGTFRGAFFSASTTPRTLLHTSLVRSSSRRTESETRCVLHTAQHKEQNQACRTQTGNRVNTGMDLPCPDVPVVCFIIEVDALFLS